jgi:hypothetical protein
MWSLRASVLALAKPQHQPIASRSFYNSLTVYIPSTHGRSVWDWNHQRIYPAILIYPLDQRFSFQIITLLSCWKPSVQRGKTIPNSEIYLQMTTVTRLCFSYHIITKRTQVVRVRSTTHRLGSNGGSSPKKSDQKPITRHRHRGWRTMSMKPHSFDSMEISKNVDNSRTQHYVYPKYIESPIFLYVFQCSMNGLILNSLYAVLDRNTYIPKFDINANPIHTAHWKWSSNVCALTSLLLCLWKYHDIFVPKVLIFHLYRE